MSSNAGLSNTYTYNGLGQRSGKVDSTGTFNFTRNSDSIDAPVVSDGAARYVQGSTGLLSEVRGGTSKYYHADALGSTRAITNTSGVVTDTKATDAFGITYSAGTSGSTPTPFGFAGAQGYQSDSDTGLMLLGHRYYDASVGRFLSRDPIQAGTNWFTYCGNDPVNGVDPSGYDWKAVVVAIMQAWSAFVGGGAGHKDSNISQNTPPSQSAPTRKVDSGQDSGGSGDNGGGNNGGGNNGGGNNGGGNNGGGNNGGGNNGGGNNGGGNNGGGNNGGGNNGGGNNGGGNNGGGNNGGNPPPPGPPAPPPPPGPPAPPAPSGPLIPQTNMEVAQALGLTDPQFGSGPPACCLGAGTRVRMGNGELRPIEDVTVGDWVLSYNERVGKIQPEQVIGTSVTDARATLRLSFSNRDDVVATSNHRFFTPGQGFVQAISLKTGSACSLSSNGTATLRRISKAGRNERVYNLNVAGAHTYLLGQSGLVVGDMTQQ